MKRKVGWITFALWGERSRRGGEKAKVGLVQWG